MKLSILLMCLLFVTLGAWAAFAQGGKGEAPAPKPSSAGASSSAAPSTYTGKSINGSLQEALSDALQKAQLDITKTVADAQFNYQLDSVTGKRGGIAATNELSVTIKILR